VETNNSDDKIVTLWGDVLGDGFFYYALLFANADLKLPFLTMLAV
jgi:hypothetical protein